MVDLANDANCQRPVYYLHIPKTAGTSFREFLQTHFDPAYSSSRETFDSFMQLPREKWLSYQLLSGHYYYDVATLLGRQPRIITVLRDPVDRTISHYYYVRKETRHFYHDIVKTQTLLEFATDPRTIGQYANFQTRHLGLKLDHWELVERVRKDNSQPLAKYVEAIAPNGFDDPEVLARAKARIAECEFVGIAEWLDASVQLLAHQFGWEHPAAAPKRNLTPRPKDPTTDEAIEVIRSNTRQCAEIYELACRNFAARFNRFADEHPHLHLQKVQVLSDEARIYRKQIADHERVIEEMQRRISELEGKVNANSLALCERMASVCRAFQRPMSDIELPDRNATVSASQGDGLCAPVDHEKLIDEAFAKVRTEFERTVLAVAKSSTIRRTMKAIKKRARVAANAVRRVFH